MSGTFKDEHVYDNKMAAAYKALEVVQRSRDELELIRRELDRAHAEGDVDSLNQLNERLLAMDIETVAQFQGAINPTKVSSRPSSAKPSAPNNMNSTRQLNDFEFPKRTNMVKSFSSSQLDKAFMKPFKSSASMDISAKRPATVTTVRKLLSRDQTPVKSSELSEQMISMLEGSGSSEIPDDISLDDLIKMKSYMQEKKKELAELQLKLKELQQLENDEFEEKVEIVEENEVETHEQEEEETSELDALMKRLASLEVQQEKLANSRPVREDKAAVDPPVKQKVVFKKDFKGDLDKLDQLQEKIMLNVTTLKKYYDELHAIRGMGGDVEKVDSMLDGLRKQLAQLKENNDRVVSMRESIIMMKKRSEAMNEIESFENEQTRVINAKQSKPKNISDAVKLIESAEHLSPNDKIQLISSLDVKDDCDNNGDIVLGDVQLEVLDEVAAFMAKFDSDSQFTMDLFRHLKLLETPEQKRLLVDFVKQIVKSPTSKEKEDMKTPCWTSGYETAPDASDAKDIVEIIEAEPEPEVDNTDSYELSIADFITNMTAEAESNAVFTVADLEKVKLFVIKLVRNNIGELSQSWTLRFGGLVYQTISSYAGTRMAETKTSLLRDVNSLLYDVLALSDGENDEEEDEPQEAQVSVESSKESHDLEGPFESSLQWETLVEEDEQRDGEKYEKTPRQIPSLSQKELQALVAQMCEKYSKIGADKKQNEDLAEKSLSSMESVLQQLKQLVEDN